MSETTKILFNSPALHSLKREQLMKLCKIHSIKANGKNVELIERLKQHAQTLPKDDPLSIAARSETSNIVAKPLCNSSDTLQDESDLVIQQAARPSEQWEVMESIQEVDETSSQGTLSSLRTIGTPQNTGEFGTTGSKTSTVGSSLRALATSLGLKRTYKTSSTTSSKASVVDQERSNDELVQHSIPYSAVRPATPPISDNFTFDPATAPHTRMSFASNGEPLPGCSLRPGVPAPENARLSLSTTPMKQQQTTTIRLVSSDSTNGDEPTTSETFHTPKLKPLTPSFELVMSPGVQSKESATGAFWAPDTQPRRFHSIYPTLTVDDLPSPIKLPADRGSGSDDGNALIVPTTSVPTVITTPTTPTPDPFVFGSPLPQHAVSNTQFRAAASSVLEEMNKRLLSSGVEGLNTNLISKLQPGAHTREQLEAEGREVRPLPGGRSSNAGRGEITNKFDQAHEAEFAKMEGIDGVVRRKEAGKKNSGENLPKVQPLAVGKKRKSSVLGDAPRRPTTGPGAALGGKASGSTRVISNGRRARALPGAFGDDDDGDNGVLVDENGTEERGAKRAKVDADTGNREEGDDMDVDKEDQEEDKNQREREREAIKRKLEMSRAKRRSSAGGAVAAASARRSSRVSGARGPITPKTKTGRFGFLISAKNLVASVWGKGKTAPPASTKDAPKANDGTAKESTNKSSMFKKKGPTSAFVPAKSSAALFTSGTSNSRLSVAQEQKSSTARSRSPIPPVFSNNSGAATTASRMSLAQTDSATGTRMSRVSAATTGSGGVSSIGAKPSAASNATVGSMGIKLARLRTSSTTSRLLAPTASSLAKTKKLDAVTSPPPSVAASASGTHIGPKKTSLLSPITNSPRAKIPIRGTTLSPFSSLRPKTSSLSMLSPESNQNAAPGSRIFSKPVAVEGGSKIPTLSLEPSKDQDVMMAEAETGKEVGMAQKNMGSVARQRTITRKPRISRSKVIARLASQRAAGSSSRTQVRSGTPACGSAAANGSKPRTPVGTHKRTRSSIGARPSRASFGGPVRGGNLGGGRGDREMSILASAKKRVRQSEYARRRSRISGIAVQVDAEI